MLVNDIKKGMRVKLHNGWLGTMADNKRGNIRTVNVEGIYTEMGSVYAKDIRSVLNPATNAWEFVELSPAQKKASATIRAFGF